METSWAALSCSAREQGRVGGRRSSRSQRALELRTPRQKLLHLLLELVPLPSQHENLLLQVLNELLASVAAAVARVSSRVSEDKNM